LGVAEDIVPNRDDPLGILVMVVRQALLMMADAIEVYFGITPRTSELRKEKKEK
jgi:hypothetical protein